jgi:hypothetical protein
MKYIINSSAIVFFFNGKPLKIEKSSHEYNRIIKCFDLPDSEQEDAIHAILDEKVGQFERDGFSIAPDGVSYDGEALPDVLADKVRQIAAEGLPVSMFAKFWENLNNNPSANSVRELYDFLAYKELPITEDGCFIAYKGVDSSGLSLHGNTKTKVIQGIVDGNGKIQNNVGDTIEVKRWDVDDRRENHCSFGLHVGSLDYASSFGHTTLVVKINPADVVSIPDDCRCQKARVCKYEVLDSFANEITNAVTDEDGNPIESEVDLDHQEFLARIERYLTSKGETHDVVSIRAIQNSFSPDYPSKIRVCDALTELGVSWGEERDGYAGGWADTILD